MVYGLTIQRVRALLCKTSILSVSMLMLSAPSLWAQEIPKEIYGPRHINDLCELTPKHLEISPTSILSIAKAGQKIANDLPRYSIDINTDALNEVTENIPVNEELLHQLETEDFGRTKEYEISFEDFIEDPIFDYDITAIERIKQEQATRDTLASLATREALSMIEQHYVGIMNSSPEGSSQAISEAEMLTLSRRALQKSAEKAFREFVKDSFHKYTFDGLGYSTIRSSYMNTYMSVVERALGNVGKKVADGFTKGDFKNFKFDSELLKDLNKDIATGLIDSSIKLAHNSQYSFLRNLEVRYKIKKNKKPEYSVTTLQPLYSSEKRRHNLFAQGTFSSEDDRRNFSAGMGYRYMPDTQNYVVGSNVFFDFQKPYNHMRASFGLDIHTSLLSASTNFYKGLNNWKNARFGFEEKPLDGLDLELAGRMPFLPALEVSARGYAWKASQSNNNVEGVDLRMAYSPVPAFTIEGGFTDESNQDRSFDFALRYNYIFGAPPEYLYDWNEQFRKKSAAEFIYSKARRVNTIRVEERIDPDLLAAGLIPPSLLLSAPTAGATGLSVGSDLVLTFSEDVLAGAGNIIFTDTTDASDNFNIPVTDPRVTIVNNVVTVDLSAQLLEFNSGYEVTMASGVFTDTGSTAFAGLSSGDLAFQTVVDPTATFGAPDQTLAPGASAVGTISTSSVASFQTTLNIMAAPDGIIFECGGTGQGIAAWFDGGNLVYGAGDGSVTATNADTVFGIFPIASIPQGLHHFTFVAEPNASAEIGVYMDGIRIINQSIVGAMDSGRWSGGNDCGHGLQGGTSLRVGGNANALTNATLTGNLNFYDNDQPLDF